jgi:thiosulfate reductase cytochrome b subunit
MDVRVRDLQPARRYDVRQQLYSWYERLWHWLQAAAILLLVLTGVAIHAPDRLGWLPFATAVRVHNLLGFFLLANAFLGMFYYVTTGTIRQYIPEPRDFVSLAVRQAMFYLRGMFRGEPHPLDKTTERRLNPLQQVTYLAILNVLLPLQMITGLLMWGGQHWPESVRAIGGPPILGPLHTAGAWAFVSFVVMHIYLTTTGETPLSNIKAMLTGYEDAGAARHPGPETAERSGQYDLEGIKS